MFRTMRCNALEYLLVAAVICLTLSPKTALSVTGWSSAGTMSSSRGYHSATLLPNGKVLVTGGEYVSCPNGSCTINNILSSAELFDPSTSTWSSAGNMASPRMHHTATMLPNGKVLIAGGVNRDNTQSSAELYDPASNTWSSAGAMPDARYGHTAALLPDGKVFVAGGYGLIQNAGLLYDPITNTWSSAGLTEKYLDGAITTTVLPNGKVLAAGDFTMLFDPATETWNVAGNMVSARRHHTATQLLNGNVLVAGGTIISSYKSTEIYTPMTNTWSPARDMLKFRESHTATLLFNGMILVAGGDASYYPNNGSAELYDPTTNSWSSAGMMLAARSGHTATLLPNGKVLIIGGIDYNSVSSAEIYDPSVTATVPDSPTGVNAIAGNSSSKVTFVAPANNGGAVITSYTVTAIPTGGPVITATGSASPITINGLTNGTAYAFTVSATNSIGTGTVSAPSTTITPTNLLTTISSPSRSFANSSDTITYNVSYNGADTITLSTNNIILNASGTASGVISVSGSGTTSRTVSISNLTGLGTLGISIANGTASANSGTVQAAAPPASQFFVVDTINPKINTFSVPITSTSLTVPVNQLTDFDAAGVAGYRLTESPTPPLASDIGWISTKPTSYTFTSSGNKTLYAWVKDSANNVSASAVASILVDNIKPTVSAFALPALTNSLNIPILNFIATDNLGLAGYLITRSSTTPSPSDTAWSTNAQTSYTLPTGTTSGVYTLYAWTKDNAGNISVSSNASVTIDLAIPKVTGFSVTLPVYTNTMTFAVAQFNASDSYGGVTGYMISETPTPPLPNDVGWSATPPTSYTFTSVTSKILYPWSKDASGNVSVLSPFTISNDLCSVSASSDSNGTITLSGVEYYYCNQNRIFNITPSPGYRISDVIVDGQSVGKVSNYRFGSSAAGTTHTITATFELDPFANWHQVSPGYLHTIAVRADGTMWAWGDNSSNQLGDGTSTARYNPIRVTSYSDWQSSSAGPFHSLARRSNGTLYGWGDNTTGQLGTSGSTLPVLLDSNTYWQEIAAAGSVTTTLAQSNSYSIARRSDGSFKQIGTSPPAGSSSASAMTDWISLAAGLNHTVAIRADGTIWSWGANSKGQLGDTSTTTRSIPVQAGIATNWIQIAAGAAHTVGLQANGTLWTWGDNSTGQLGTDQIPSNSTSPYQVGINQSWKAIAAGDNHTLALRSDGTIWAFGSNAHGQLGDGTGATTNFPVQVGTDADWKSITAHGDISYGIKNNNTLYAWGANSKGQLGDTTNVDKLSPVLVGTNTNSFVIAATASTGGSISPSGAINAASGTSKTFSIAPLVGWHITDVIVDGVSQGALTSYNFTSVVDRHTISVSFAADATVTHNISASTGPGASISPNGAVVVADGASQSFTIAVQSGYQISDVLVDSISKGALTSYTFSNVTTNHTISVTASVVVNSVNGVCGSSNNSILTTVPSTNLCSAGTASAVTGTGPWIWSCSGQSGGTNARCSALIQAYAVSSSVSGSNGTISCTSPIIYGGASTCTITPASGYRLATLSDNSADVLASVGNNVYAIANVSATHTVVATFSLIPAGTINGACGISNTSYFRAVPTSNLCSTGTASSVTGTGPWSWSCNGVGGGSTASCSANLDNAGPTLNISTLANNAITNNASLNISGIVSDTNGVASVKVNNATVTVTNGSFSYAITLQSGANTLSVVATDSLGNISTDTRSITLDTTAPNINVTSPADNISTAQNTVTVNGTLSESSTVTVTDSGGASQSATVSGSTFSAIINLMAGLNSINIKAIDQAGNNSSVVRSIMYDNSVPSLAITNPAQDTTVTQNNVTISGTVSDSLTTSTVKVTHNGLTYSPTITNGAFSQPILITANGTWPIKVTATDAVGNSTSITRNVIYNQTIGTSLPHTGIVNPVAGKTSPDISDAQAVLQYVSGNSNMTSTQIAGADVAPFNASGLPQGNGVVDLADVIMILRRSIGIGTW